MDSITIGDRDWRLGQQLGVGGFGRVYEATSSDGSNAVAKLVPKAPGASRELLFEHLENPSNIVPILATGETETHYVLIMPRADKSLREHILEHQGRLTVDEALVVLSDIASALASLESSVVHRDLKPENVLLLEDRWCLADFGIARYAEATTAPDTHKYAWTPAYASPEQWRAERASAATDVYAFGVMAYEMLEGRLPFSGPDFRDQHLKAPVPTISDCPPSLTSLINECMFKAPAARPTPANILARLQAGRRTASPAGAKLQQVNKGVVEQRSHEVTLASAQKSVDETRSELYNAASLSLARVKDLLREAATDNAPAANVSAGKELSIQLGSGLLRVSPVAMAPPDSLAAFDYLAPFDVIAFATVEARKPRDRYGYEGRAHSLWFCDAQTEGVYRWYELAFMVQPLVPERFSVDPFALPPTDKQAAECLTPVMTVRQVAWQPVAFDQGDEARFVERWLGWFAAAADGSLAHPSSMPEPSGGHYRFVQNRRR